MNNPAAADLPAFDAPLRHLDDVLKGVRAGRATPALVENVSVECYGSRMRIRELATISVPDQKTIVVESWDKNLLPAIEKAIATSSIGVNPVVSGTTVRVPVPPLTEERRHELGRLIRQHVEETRIAIRQIREKRLKDLKGQKDSGELSEDAFERERKRFQAAVDTAIAAVEQRGKEKEEDIRTV